MPGAQILSDYELLLVPVTGINKPGITREYPGKRVTPLVWREMWGMRQHFHFENGFLENMYQIQPRRRDLSDDMLASGFPG